MPATPGVHPVTRLGAAGVVLGLVLGVMAGCASAPAALAPAADAGAPPATPAPATAVAPGAPVDVTLRDPAGPCEETDTTVEPPSDYEETCTYLRMVVGHTLPPSGAETYLSRIVPSLHDGSRVMLEGRVWSVETIESIPKRELPDSMYLAEGAERYLVTCDPDSGYTRWSDGVMHANNNLVVVLEPTA